MTTAVDGVLSCITGMVTTLQGRIDSMGDRPELLVEKGRKRLERRKQQSAAQPHQGGDNRTLGEILHGPQNPYLKNHELLQAQQSQAYMNAIYSCAGQDSRLEYYRTTYGEEAYKDLQNKLGEFFKEPSDKKQEPVKVEKDIEIMSGSDFTQEITVAEGYMRIKHTYFYRPKWWQFWKAPSVTKMAWYTTLIGNSDVDYHRWCTEDGRGVDLDTRLWLQKISDAYFGRLRAKQAAAKLREVDARMESPEIQALDPSSPSYDPMKKIKKEKVSA